jgi:hypothetical protein
MQPQHQDIPQSLVYEIMDSSIGQVAKKRALPFENKTIK